MDNHTVPPYNRTTAQPQEPQQPQQKHSQGILFLVLLFEQH